MSKLRRIPREGRVALTAVLAVIAVTLAMVTVTGARAEAAEPTDFEPNYDMGLESVRNSGDDSWGPLVWAGTPPEGNSTGNAANDVGWGWCIDYTQADPMHKGGSYKKSTAGALSFDDPKYQDAVIGLALKLRDAQENGQKQLAKKYIVYLSAIISDPSGREAAINFINGNLGYGDANNVSRFQGFEGSPQEFTELTGLRIVKTTAQNLDDQFDVDPSVKVDKQPADAFLTIVGPNGIYKHTSGGGQRVLPPDQPGLPDDDGGEDRNPEISTQAEFAGDADQVVAGAKVTDTVEYKDLVPGKKYTLNAELVNKADKSVVGKGEKTFTPQESAGKVDVEITVDSDVTEPVEAAVAFEELTSTEVDAKGEETPDAEKPNKVAEHKDIDDADQTVTSKKDEKPEKSDRNPEISTQAEFAGDADQVVAGAKVTDTVEYKDLVPGKKYTL
ncbi:VaFE repeat-containing surface-anchored protein, partial [Corynebacterium segmentosum]